MKNIISWAKENKTLLILAVIVIVGFLVRLITINSQDGLWCDEAYSWWASTLPFPFGIINELKLHDYHPPLYHFILHFWMKLFGDSDVVLRLLSVIFSTATILISYFIGEKLKDKTCGLICATLNAFLLFNLIHAQEVRFYVPSVTFAALSLLFTLKVFDEEKITKPLIGLIISNALLIYTLTTGAVFVVITSLVLFIFLIIYKKDAVKKFVLSQLVAFFVCLPQIIFMLGQYLNSKKGNPWIGMPIDPFAIFNYIWESFAKWNIINERAYGVMGVLLSVALIIILFKIFYNRNRKFWIILSVLSIYFLFLFAAAYFKILPLSFNYTGIFMMVFIVMISSLITEYKRPLSLILFLTVFLVQIYFGCMAYKEDSLFSVFYKREGYKIPATYLKKNGYNKNLLIFMGWGDRLIGYIGGDNIKRLKEEEPNFIEKVPVGGHFVIISAANFKDARGANQIALKLYNLANEEKRFKKVFMSEDLSGLGQQRLGVYKIVIFKRIK